MSVFGRSPHLEQVWIRLRAGYMSESPHFYGWMTARRFLAFIAGVYPSWDWGQANRLLEEFGLTGDRKVEELSKGNRIKLDLVAAVAHRPQLLMLDELTAGLDPLVRVDILGFLENLVRHEGAGIVMSSHVSDDLDRIADSVLMLHEGTVKEYAPAKVLLEKYNHSQLEAVFLDAIGRVPATGAHIIRKDWAEYRRMILGLTAALLVPGLLIVFFPVRSADFAKGLLAGLLGASGLGYAQFCFLNERQRSTLDLLLSLPIEPHQLVLAKYASLYSMVLFTVNIPALLVPDLQLIFMINTAALTLATIFMAATVISDKPWAAQLPIWLLLIFIVPSERLLTRFYPPGLDILRTITAHPNVLATLALLLTATLVGMSVLCFSTQKR